MNKMIIFLKITAALFGFISGLILIAATYYPQVETNLGYTYSFIMPYTQIIYGIGIFIIIFSLIADKLKGIGSRLVIIPLLLISGVIIYSYDITKEGELWAARQAAFDIPNYISLVNYENFWDEINNLGGNSNLRELVASWGVHVTWNNVPVYENFMFSLSKEQADNILESSNRIQIYDYLGLVGFLFSFIFQLLSAIFIWITPKKVKIKLDS